MTNEMIFTYQTRLVLDDKQDEILQQYANLLNKVERSLYAEVAKGKTSASCKNDFLKKFEVTARQFNGCRVSLEGKIEACKAAQNRAIESLKEQIAQLILKIKLLEKKTSKHFVLHQKKRRLTNLQQLLTSTEKDRQEKRVRLCFGSKKLFKGQFNLKNKGFKSYLEWKEAWKASRNNEFFLLGSKDESSGNQTCTAKLQSDGKLCLRLRLPKNLEGIHGKYIEIPNITFSYGHQAIIAALNYPEGQAISYRFKKDAKGWRVFASTVTRKVDCV